MHFQATWMRHSTTIMRNNQKEDYLMSLKEILEQEREAKIIEHAIDFVENIEPVLIESAKKGFTGHQISFEGRNDTHILRNEEFLKNIELLLDGCKAEVRKEEFKNILFGYKYYKSKLVITWSQPIKWRREWEW